MPQTRNFTNVLPSQLGLDGADKDFSSENHLAHLERPSSLLPIDAVALKCNKLKGISRLSCFFAAGNYSSPYIAAHPMEVNYICQYGNTTDRKLCITGLFLRKKGDRLTEALAAACQHLRDRELQSVCQDQQRRYLYQIDNPITDLMFDEG